LSIFMARYHSSAMDDELLSKTRKKAQMHALQKLGAELVELSKERLASMDLPETLLDAIREAQRITAHEGRRRQMQYIGRLMRDIDPAPIQERLDAWRGQSKAEVARQHGFERLRDKLIADDAALTAYAEAHPGVDIQSLRNLIRNARKEAAQGRPPKSYREIFKIIRDAE
jgi:ribosome-associated protein